MKKLLIVIAVLLLLSGCKDKAIDNNGDIELTDNYKTSEYVTVTAQTINDMDNDSYLIYTYLPYCTFKIPCDTIFKKVMDKYNLKVYGLPFDELKKTKFAKDVNYAPSFLIVNEGNLVAYLDANSKKDYDRYQDSDEFEKWLGTYVKLKIE
jgi:protein involved in sex pheromone biosynthesis